MFQDLNPLDKPTAMMEILIMVAGAAIIGFLIGWIYQKLHRDRIKADLRFTADKLRTSQAKADEAVKEQAELKRIVDDLRIRKNALFSELESQKDESDKLGQLPELKEKVHQLETERDALSAELSELKEQGDNTTDLERLKSELNNLSKERDALKLKLTEAATDTGKPEEIERLQASLTSSREEQQRLRNQVETLSQNTVHRDELNRLESEITSLKTEKLDLEGRLKKMSASGSADGKSKNTKKLSKLENKYRKLEEEYKELQQKLDAHPNFTPTDPAEIAAMRLHIAELEKEKSEFQERLSTLEKLEHAKLTRNADEDDDATGNQSHKSSLSNEDYENRKQLLLGSVGTATEDQKDSFSKIIGIGPFIEAKLNSIGILTYDQISRLSEEDIDHVTRLIEFFPGRIERDGWVRQAVKLIKKREEGEEEEDD